MDYFRVFLINAEALSFSDLLSKLTEMYIKSELHMPTIACGAEAISHATGLCKS
ncbi:MAG: hypothetical protein SOR57_09005 [Parabacteroides sp.]|nr:hypothetical protein [Parabacteroides sp.]